ncbi:hypothetical protein [Mycobacterium sp. E2327]|uniref:hypothetical protein n=1 Tax=Mycobacterium sp. E2327 TaxID=1834132 RepID=UPI000AD78FB5|nr:hypothetical protein [Mycobacterium sp. E2327]
MKTLLTALVHRLRQARGVLLRAQLALTGAQILFWVTLIGAPVGLALRARQRRMRRELPRAGDAVVPPQVN